MRDIYLKHLNKSYLSLYLEIVPASMESSRLIAGGDAGHPAAAGKRGLAELRLDLNEGPHYIQLLPLKALVSGLG
jgi:hypothetical protein